jgi:hypothetical protein
MTFYVARIGTKEAASQISEIKEKLYGLFPKPNDIDEHEVFANWLAYYGVKGWDDVTDGENDKPLEFTPTFARSLFLNKQYWMSLNQVLISHAANYENFLNDQAYEDAEELGKH